MELSRAPNRKSVTHVPVHLSPISSVHTLARLRAAGRRAGHPSEGIAMGPSLPLNGCHRRGYPGLKRACHKAATVARARYAGRSPRVLPHDRTASLPAPHPLPTPTPPPRAQRATPQRRTPRMPGPAARAAGPGGPRKPLSCRRGPAAPHASKLVARRGWRTGGRAVRCARGKR